MNVFNVALLAAALASAPVAHPAAGEAPAKTLTAVCKAPKGAVIAGRGGPLIEPDSFGSGMFTYSWRLGDTHAKIITQSGDKTGSLPGSEDATAVGNQNSVTFLVLYPEAVWMHTLFFGAKEVLISRHVYGDVTRGGTFVASCAMSVR